VVDFFLYYMWEFVLKNQYFIREILINNQNFIQHFIQPFIREILLNNQNFIQHFIQPFIIKKTTTNLFSPSSFLYSELYFFYQCNSMQKKNIKKKGL